MKLSLIYLIPLINTQKAHKTRTIELSRVHIQSILDIALQMTAQVSIYTIIVLF